MPKSKHIQVPRELFSIIVVAIRKAAVDTRDKDRTVTDDTREAIQLANEDLSSFIDARAGVE